MTKSNTKDPAREAEDLPANRDRIRFTLRALAKRHRFILTPAFEDALVSLVVVETTTVRHRVALLVDLFAEHVAHGVDSEKLGNLAFVCLAHHVADDGTAFMPADLDKNLGIE